MCSFYDIISKVMNMKYREDKYGNKLSALGFGCLRLPGKKGKIDIAETEREILLAIEEGVNFFDTAYIYPGSEAAIGEIFEKNNLRDKVYISTKLPHYLIKSRDGLDKLFNEQLKRLRTDRVDYYFMPKLQDSNFACPRKNASDAIRLPPAPCTSPIQTASPFRHKTYRPVLSQRKMVPGEEICC